jgi:phosphoethanolamine N-methyltransferase
MGTLTPNDTCDHAILGAHPTKRETMLKFWENYQNAPTVESMMLSEDAKDFCEDDRLDIYSCLPNLTGKNVLELGAGIGRFTGLLAQKAKHVRATDFIEAFVLKNYETHKHLPNVTCETSDSTALELEEESVDFVFTNWLLMYLTDVELVAFVQTLLKGLTPGGQIHIRESCTERSTRKPTSTAENPTYYRHPSQYVDLLNTTRVVNEKDGKTYCFIIQWVKSVPTYINLKNNWRQVHLIAQKLECPQSMINPSPESGFIVPSSNDLMGVLQSASAIQLGTDTVFQKMLEYFGGARTPLDDFFTAKLAKTIGSLKDKGILNVASAAPASLVGVSSFKIAEGFDACVVGIEIDQYAYSTLLGQCNIRADKRVRCHMAFLDYPRNKEYCDLPEKKFHVAVGVNVLSDSEDVVTFCRNLKNLMAPDGQFLFLEANLPYTTENEESTKYISEVLAKAGFDDLKIYEANGAHSAIQQSLSHVAAIKVSFIISKFRIHTMAHRYNSLIFVNPETKR